MTAMTPAERKRKQRERQQGHTITVVLTDEAKAMLDAITAKGMTQSEAINKILTEVA